jgi:hypothetical protein
MGFSEGRKSQLAHLIVERLVRDGQLEVDSDRHVLKAIKQALDGEGAAEQMIDIAARRKIASLARTVPDGSREWEVLYRKYADEERKKIVR